MGVASYWADDDAWDAVDGTFDNDWECGFRNEGCGHQIDDLECGYQNEPQLGYGLQNEDG